jgi:hypothetical protein
MKSSEIELQSIREIHLRNLFEQAFLDIPGHPEPFHWVENDCGMKVRDVMLRSPISPNSSTNPRRTSESINQQI